MLYYCFIFFSLELFLEIGFFYNLGMTWAFTLANIQIIYIIYKYNIINTLYIYIYWCWNNSGKSPTMECCVKKKNPNGINIDNGCFFTYMKPRTDTNILPLNTDPALKTYLTTLNSSEFQSDKNSKIHGLHPGRLTWNIIMEVWKSIFLSKWVICRFHVNLPGCIDSNHYTSSHNRSIKNG